MSQKQFERWLRKQGIVKSDSGYYRMPFVLEKAPNVIGAEKQERKILGVTISTVRPDRHGDILEPSGMDAKAFMKNPVVLWAHDYKEPPIGRVTSLNVEKAGIKADIEFADSSWRAYEVFDLYAKGFMRAWSVGFLPLQWEIIEDKDGKFTGYHITKWELLELSAVPVPANADALCNAMQKGLSIRAELLKELGINPDDADATDAAEIEDDEPPEADEKTAELQASIKALTEEVALLKEGRVLSKKNRTLLETCSEKMMEAVAAIDDLLESSSPSKDDDEKSVSTPEVPDLAETQAGDQVKAVQPEIKEADLDTLAGRVAESMQKSIGEAISAGVATALAKRMGRVE